MRNKRFKEVYGSKEDIIGVVDNVSGKKMVCTLDLIQEMNGLAEENEQLKERLEKINGGYGHLTHYNGLTANEWLIRSQEKELKKKDERISEWIEQHSKDIAKIGEQNKLIRNLKEENERLKKEINEVEKESERLRKIGVMYQGHNPCENCTYCFENKVCCAEPVIPCDDAKKNFIQGLCKKHKQIVKSYRRYGDD